MATKRRHCVTTCERVEVQQVVHQRLCKSLRQCMYLIAFSIICYFRDHPHFCCLCWYKVDQKQHDICISADDQYSFVSLVGGLIRMEYQPGVRLFMVSLKFDFAPSCWSRMFSWDAMTSFHTCGSRTVRPLMTLRIAFFFPHLLRPCHCLQGLLLDVAVTYYINSCCVTSEVTCHIFREHISIVAKRLAPMRFSKSLDQAMTVNHHTRLHVGFWNCWG